MREINNLKEFLFARKCGEKNWEELQRNTFKYTECGMWIQKLTERVVDCESPHIEEFNDAPTYKRTVGVVVGSIVEGADCECTPIELKFPFTMDEFSEACDSVEEEAKEIWDEWNDDSFEQPTTRI